MSDDLVKRLREIGMFSFGWTANQAADRIEQLEREMSICRMAQVVMDNTVEALTAERDAAVHLARMRKSFIEEARDERDAAEAERDRLRSALIEERTETLWNAYGTGMERDGRWRHMCMSDGEWLEFECGLDNNQPDHPADVVKAAIPFAAERFVAALTGKEPMHD